MVVNAANVTLLSEAVPDASRANQQKNEWEGGQKSISEYAHQRIPSALHSADQPCTPGQIHTKITVHSLLTSELLTSRLLVTLT